MSLIETLLLFENVKPINTLVECLQIYTETLECHLSPKKQKRKQINIAKKYR